jgi:hypothetical protein
MPYPMNNPFTVRELRNVLTSSTIVQIILDLDEAEQNQIDGCPTEEEYKLLLRAQKLEFIEYLKVSDGIEFEHAPGDGGLRVVER